MFAQLAYSVVEHAVRLVQAFSGIHFPTVLASFASIVEGLLFDVVATKCCKNASFGIAMPVCLQVVS
jgi:hypothetical protein